MLHGYRLFTLTHRHASLDQLEPYVIGEDDLADSISALQNRLGWDEVFYLNTCNRVLFFFYQSDRDATTVAEFKGAIGASEDAVDPVYMEAEAAVMHLYDVAASVDSMVVGEREILRQLRHSYLRCYEAGHCGDNLRLAMQSAVAAAKKVYHQTRIGQKPVSVVSLAAQRIRQQRLDVERARVLLVGAGQTNWLISKFLRKQGFANVTVANRTLAKAEKLARTYSGATSKGIELEALGSYTEGFDLLIVCTASTEPIITPSLFGQLLAGEEASEKVVVDLSIPYNVASAVVEEFEPTYIQIDDLRRLASDNLAFRSSEVVEARKLIGQELLAFRDSVQQRVVERALSHLPEQIHAIKQRAMNEVFSRELAELDGTTVDLIGRMMTYMEKKCVGVPMKAARKAVVAA